MTVFYVPCPEALGPRIGITVSRALGGAVQRNRIKRRMREAVRLHLGELTAVVDVVVNPKKLVLDAEFVQVEQDVKKAFEVIEKAALRTSNGHQQMASRERSTSN